MKAWKQKGKEVDVEVVQVICHHVLLEAVTTWDNGICHLHPAIDSLHCGVWHVS